MYYYNEQNEKVPVVPRSPVEPFVTMKIGKNDSVEGYRENFMDNQSTLTKVLVIVGIILVVLLLLWLLWHFYSSSDKSAKMSVGRSRVNARFF